jgi:hypothetical protein
MIVYLLTKFNFFKNDHIHMHQHSLLARAFFKNLSVGREQSTKREHTPLCFSTARTAFRAFCEQIFRCTVLHYTVDIFL